MSTDKEPTQPEIFCGVDFGESVVGISVMRRRADGVAELLHSEEIPLLPAKTCGTCKHWRVLVGEGEPACRSPDVRKMIDVDAYAGYSFEPPADFGCNRWEAK